MSVTPAVTRRLMRELSELQNNPPEGIRVATSEDNMLDVTGIIEGPEGTPYAGGYFRVKFKFTEEFPAAPPKCWFATKIFHPNVSSAGEICVNTLKKDWKPTYGISHILVTVKCLLIYPNPESALDEDAGKLLLENYDDYFARAKLITSVHATPRVRPVEFDPSASGSGSSTASTTAPSVVTGSATPVTKSSTTISIAIPDSVIPVSTSIPAPRKSVSPGPPSHPLQSSPSSNAIPLVSLTPSLSSESEKGKERHPSPSPLGTADANVDTNAKEGRTAPAPSGTTKSMKRGAASGGATGAEKRKKALKRL